MNDESGSPGVGNRPANPPTPTTAPSPRAEFPGWKIGTAVLAPLVVVATALVSISQARLSDALQRWFSNCSIVIDITDNDPTFQVKLFFAGEHRKSCRSPFWRRTEGTSSRSRWWAVLPITAATEASTSIRKQIRRALRRNSAIGPPTMLPAAAT